MPVVLLPLTAAGVPKVQINTNFVDGGTFKNFFTTLGTLIPSVAGYAYPAVLNVDQYPTGTIGATLTGAMQLPSNLTTSTTLVCAWTGTISGSPFGAMGIVVGAATTVTVGNSFVVGATTSNIFLNGTNGYIEFNFNSQPGAGLSFQFNTGSTFTGFSGLIICAKTDYASIIAATDAGQLIAGAYVTAMKGLSPKIVRPMQWSVIDDGNNITQHQYRLHWQTAMNFGQAWIPNCWASTTSGTNSYTIGPATDTPVSYTMGEVLQLQFVNASTSTPLTINVNSRGVVPLLDISGNALISSAIAANALATLIYDDLLAGYIVSFSGLSAAVPVEIQVGLANQVGCALWYNLAPHIIYTSVSSIIALIASTLNGDLYVEYANEVWNFSGGFQQTPWAVNCGATLGFPSASGRQYHSFYALRIAQIMPLVTTAWGGRGGLHCVLAFQAFGDSAVGGATNLYRLKGADLDTTLGYTKYNSYVGTNYHTSPNRPVDVSDALAYADYSSGAQCANFDANYSNAGGTGLTTGHPSSGPGSAINGLVGAADAFASGDTTNSIAWLDWDMRQGTNNGTLGGQTLLSLNSALNGVGIYPVWETIAAGYDGARPAGKVNLTVNLYEGGAIESIAPSTAECTTLGISTAYGGVGGKIDNLLTAYKNSALFYATVQQQLTNVMAQPHTKSASKFNFSGGSQWSIYQGDVYTPTWQSYAAIRAYNQTP